MSVAGGRSLDSTSVGQRPQPKPRKGALMQAQSKPRSSSDADHFQPVALRSRSESYSLGQRPQPKPRKRNGPHSALCSGTASADSSPQVPRPGNKRLSMQPTPLIQALGDQLVSRLHTSEGTAVPSDLSNNQEVKTENKDKLKLLSTNSRALAQSQSSLKSRTPPTRPPPYKAKSSTLKTSQQVSSNSASLKTEKSKTLPANLKSAGFTQHGTPFPSRPAPPPPSGKAATTKNPSSPARTLRLHSDPIPSHISSHSRAVHISSTTGSGIDSTHVEEEDGIYEPVCPLSQDSDTSIGEGQERSKDALPHDRTNPVYEDLDDNQNDSDGEYTMLQPVVLGSLAGPRDEMVPQLPPRSTQPVVQRQHQLLSGHQEVDHNDTTTKEGEADQDTGIYEPVGLPSRDSDEGDSFVPTSHGICPVYEDLDNKHDNNYTVESTCASTASSHQTASPALPPKRGSGKGILPQLPPRLTQPVVKRKHRLLQTSPQEETKNDPAPTEEKKAQDIGTYEAISPWSQETSDDSDYTPMSGGIENREAEAHASFEEDQPEPLYIEMDT